MLPRKLHLEQINRFHDKIDELDKQIQSTTDNKELRYKLTLQYFNLVKDVWSKLDDVIEDVKNSLDTL